MSKKVEENIGKEELFFIAIVNNEMQKIMDFLEEDPSLLEKKMVLDFSEEKSDKKISLNALEIACLLGNINMISFFHSKGLDIIGKENTINPLHIAIMAKQEEVVEFLLSKGANPFFKNDEGRDAIHLCLMTGSGPRIFDMIGTFILTKGENFEKPLQDTLTQLFTPPRGISSLADILDLSGEDSESDNI